MSLHYNTKKVQSILSCYEAEPAGVKANLYKILTHGKLAGTGKLVILPVDQGFEHGPDRSFAINPQAYSPHYHFQLAIDAQLSGYAAPLGMISAGADTFAGQIPLILKANSNNSLSPSSAGASQALTASVEEAARLGCIGVGFTIYPGSEHSTDMFEQVSSYIEEARSLGLFSVVWSYPRGPELTKEGETALDVVSYAAHMACLLGAHIIKVKPPQAVVSCKKAAKALEDSGFNVGASTLSQRIARVKQAAFDNRRIVIFSGGEAKTEGTLISEITEIAHGGGDGSIIGRNAFQRPKAEAITLLNKITDIYSKV